MRLKYKTEIEVEFEADVMEGMWESKFNAEVTNALKKVLHDSFDSPHSQINLGFSKRTIVEKI